MAPVCLTFDVDAEAGLGAELESSRHRLGTLTEHEFSVRRGPDSSSSSLTTAALMRQHSAMSGVKTAGSRATIVPCIGVICRPGKPAASIR
jgi:hypothetical protein